MAMLARLDERTTGFAKVLDEIKQMQLEHAKQILGMLEKHLSDDATRFEKHDGRLKSLEGWRRYILGGLGMIGVGLGIFGWLLK